jgi:ribonuclease III family protein
MTDDREIFSLPGEETGKPEEMPGPALAYIGDTVWDLIVRRHLLARKERRPDRLHKMASAFVRAKAQADAAHFLLPELTEEERAVLRRGRNAKSGSVPKNADVGEYRMATGFESLLGYLFLKNRHGRIVELAERSIAWLEERLSKERNGPI